MDISIIAALVIAFSPYVLFLIVSDLSALVNPFLPLAFLLVGRLGIKNKIVDIPLLLHAASTFRFFYQCMHKKAKK
jgi:hypothetical protein